MPRFLFRVKGRGGLTEDMTQIRIPHKKGLQNVIINVATEEKARKLARKQNDGTYWLLGVLNRSDKLIPMDQYRKTQNTIIIEGAKQHASN